MSKRAVSGIMLTILLIGMLTLAFNIQTAKAGGTIYIRADGSVEGTDKIISSDNVTYTFADNINDLIVVQRDNIVIDGDGYTLQGTGSGTGIYLSGRTNVTVQNTQIKNFFYGIYLYSSSNYNSISGNNITNNDYGITLADSSDNSIYHNNIIDNAHQVYDYSWDYPEILPSINTWDDGYPSGGNCWSDYVGVDIKSGPAQDLPGSDGIGDAPYIIDADNRDHYPLMNPYGAPPPLMYALTITATVGGTTDPAPGTYCYTANSMFQVTGTPHADYLLDHWEIDTVNVGSANPYTVTMDKDHTVKAVFALIPPPLSASISPLSASINVGQSATFQSTVSGGYTPYSYQWYLNGAPVSGATSNTWTFTPTASGIYYVHLKVTDAKGNTAQSDTARIAVTAVPVGGYSIPIPGQTTATPLTPYLILTAILTITFTTIKRKTTKKTKKPP